MSPKNPKKTNSNAAARSPRVLEKTVAKRAHSSAPAESRRPAPAVRHHAQATSRVTDRPEKPKAAADCAPAKTPTQQAARSRATTAATDDARPEMSPATPAEDRLVQLTRSINEDFLGAIRCAKALLQFARAAGQGLVGVRKLVRDDFFDNWAENDRDGIRARAAGSPRTGLAPLNGIGDAAKSSPSLPFNGDERRSNEDKTAAILPTAIGKSTAGGSRTSKRRHEPHCRLDGWSSARPAPATHGRTVIQSTRAS